MRKLILFILLLGINGAVFSQTLVMSDSSVVACSGATFFDSGGSTGNYGNDEYYTFTICSAGAGAIDVNFITWDLEGCCDYLVIYDGNNAMGPILFFGDGSFPSPGLVTSATGCLTFEFSSDGAIDFSGWEAVITTYGPCALPNCSDGIQNQGETGIDCGCPCMACASAVDTLCSITASSNIDTLMCGGGTAILTALGESEIPVLNNNFNDTSVGTGWVISPAGTFSNPCGPGPGGASDPHMWMGNTTAAPRTLATEIFAMPCGGDVCFDFRLADDENASNCEDPDAVDEGVYVQYSLDCGNSWITLNYFEPNPTGNLNAACPNCGDYTGWANYCFSFPAPPPGQEISFQWYQSGSSGTNWDHWGIDNIIISPTNCNPYYYDWLQIPGSPDNTTETVNVSTTSTFDVIYTNGIDDTCFTSVTVFVAQLDPINVTSASESCIGENDGTIDIAAANGGTAPYDYAIVGPLNQNNSTGSFSNLLPGTYYITITDQTGCQVLDSVNVPVGPVCCALVGSDSIVMGSCYESNDGIIYLNQSGGIGNVMYSIDSGSTFQTSNVFNGLSAGNYNVMIQDSLFCNYLNNVQIQEPDSIAFGVTLTHQLCAADCVGEILFTDALGGDGVYQYSVDSGIVYQADSLFNLLCSGTYNIIAQDSSGCQGTSIVVITEPTSIQSNPVLTIPLCFGACDGSINLVSSGGSGPLLFSIDSAITTQLNPIFTNVCSGTHNYVVSDSNGCSSSSVLVVADPVQLALSPTVIDATCGVSNGQIQVLASGGAGTYLYSADSGAVFGASNVFGLLPAGAYDICVQDANGCIFCETVIVNNDPAQSITGLTTTPSTCFGSCDGTLSVILTGGTPTFWYGIDGNTKQLGSNFTGICPGVHSVETIDTNGCVVVGTFTINEPAQINVNGISNSATCANVCDGSIDLNGATGGTGTYQYSIDSGVTYTSSSNFSGLCAGIYYVFIVDNNLCVGLDTLEVLEPNPLSVNLIISNTTCDYSCDGLISAIVNGGVAPYLYNWTGLGFSSDSIADSLCNGFYNLTVQDQNGCTVDSLGLAISNPIPFAITSVVIQNELCRGDCSGEIVVVAPGADQFTIDGITYQTSGVYSGLCAGTYVVQAQNALGCIADTTITIGQPQPITISGIGDTTICIGGTANIGAVVTGGTLPYTFDWGGAGVNANISISPNSNTTYSVFAIDSNNCTSLDVNINVTVKSLITGQAFSDQQICPTDSAVISADAVGGDGNHTYTWTNDQNTIVLLGTSLMVSPDITTKYIVTINDGCETPAVIDTVEISVYKTPTVDISVDAMEGCVPLEVNFYHNADTSLISSCYWSFGDGSNTTDCAPTHTYTTLGCPDVMLKLFTPDGCYSDTLISDLVCLMDYPVPGFSASPQPTTILNPQITFNNISNNSSSFHWDFGYDGQISFLEHPSHDFPDSSAGVYNVCLTATNEFGCDSTICQFVIIDDDFIIYVPNAFTPNNDGVNDIFFAELNGYDLFTFEMMIFNRWGELVFESDDANNGWDGTVHNNGVVSQTEVYVWKIYVKDEISGLNKVFTGHVSLIK